MSSPRPFARRTIGVLAVAGIALAVLGHGWRTQASPTIQDRAPSLEGGIGWFNTDRPIHLDKLKGKVVLLDFWTYCCINCHHIIPTLNRLEEKYKNQLVVIGVHTAKFEAEKDSANIRKKIAEYNIRHPVVNDANQVIWNKFNVSSWPTLVLIGPDGKVLDKAGGEVSFEILDREIGKLVRLAKQNGHLDETPVQFFAERERAPQGGLLYPGKVLADAAGKRLFISDTGHNRIVVTDLEGKFQAAIGTGVDALTDGPFDKATFNRPQGMCLVGDTLYVADTENHALRAVDLTSKTVKTVAGNGKQAGFRVNDVRGTRGSLSSPWDVVQFGNTKTLLIAMAGLHEIWTFNIARDEAQLWAGTGAEDINDGPISDANFAQPSGLTTDGKNLYVADSEGSAIRRINLVGQTHLVDTIAGTHDLAHGQSLFAFGDRDGIGNEARLQHCLGVAFGGGKLYIADSYNNKVKVCTLASGEVGTLVATGLDEPGGLSIADGKLYIADTNNHAIRAVSLDNKAVQTLNLASVQAPTIKPVPTFKGAVVEDLAPTRVAPGKALTVSVSLPLPAGYELNTQAPITYLVEAPDKPEALSADNPRTGAQIEPPTPTFSVPVPLASEAKAGETLKLKISARAMVCLPNSLCTVKNYTWNVPVTFEAEAPATVKIGAK
jgi:thiol-disulfide isomerase/thioredoxin